jgi:hypothetical protein
MNYSQQLSDIRNHLHCGIVQEATVKNTILGNESEGVLLLNKAIRIREFVIGSVCCETGFLLSTDNEKIIPYQKLTVEDLSVIHDYLVGAKQYTFTSNTELV